MTTLEQIRKEIADNHDYYFFAESNKDIALGLEYALEIIDKYAEQEPCRVKNELKVELNELEPCEDAQERYEDLCEYFGDAKDILKSRKDFKAWLDRIKWHIHKAEELYEKYEHKQEPCDDVVSRQAVDKYIVELLSGYLYAEERERLEKLNAYLWELPPVQPKSETVTEFADRCRECGKQYVKRQTGHWIKYGKLYQCSKCKELSCCQGKFCNECGAKMVEPQESEEV